MMVSAPALAQTSDGTNTSTSTSTGATPDLSLARDGDAQKPPVMATPVPTTAGSLRLPRETGYDGDDIDGGVGFGGNVRMSSVTARSRPAYDAVGLRIGSFTAYPEVDTLAGYDGNVFALSNGAGDVYGNARASVRVSSDWGRNNLEVLGYVNERAYAKYTSESGVTYRALIRGQYDIARGTSFSLSALHQHLFVERGNTGETITTLRPVRDNETLGTAALTQGFGRLQAKLSVDLGRYVFEDAQTPAGLPLSEQYRDNSLYRGTVELGYTTSAGSVLFVSLGRELRRFRVPSAPVIRDSNGIEALGGVSGQITPLISGRLAIGYIEADFRAPNIRSRGAFDFDANIDYAVTELTSVNLTARRYFQNVAAAASPAGLATEATLGVDHELLRNVIVSASASYRSTRYLDTNNVSSGTEVDGGFKWLLNRHLRATAGAGYSNRMGNAVVSDRKFHEFDATVGLAFAL